MVKMAPAQCLTPVWCWHKCSSVCHGQISLCQVEISPERQIFIDSQSSSGWKIRSNDDETFCDSKIFFLYFAAFKTKGFLDSKPQPRHPHTQLPLQLQLVTSIPFGKIALAMELSSRLCLPTVTHETLTSIRLQPWKVPQ